MLLLVYSMHHTYILGKTAELSSYRISQYSDIEFPIDIICPAALLTVVSRVGTYSQSISIVNAIGLMTIDRFGVVSSVARIEQMQHTGLE
jgi:hypothetical protein